LHLKIPDLKNSGIIFAEQRKKSAIHRNWMLRPVVCSVIEHGLAPLVFSVLLPVRSVGEMGARTSLMVRVAARPRDAKRAAGTASRQRDAMVRCVAGRGSGSL
jgi:hypothetical protein